MVKILKFVNFDLRLIKLIRSKKPSHSVTQAVFNYDLSFSLVSFLFWF